MNGWIRKAVPLVALALLVPASALAFVSQRVGDSADSSSFDPTYNVCRGVDPACYNDWGTPRDNRVLVFSRTAGPRHANLGTSFDPDAGANAGLGLSRPYVITHDHSNPAVWAKPLVANNVVQRELVRMLEAEGIEVHVTEDVRALQALSPTSRYKAVIFASPTRDALWNHAVGAQGGTRLDGAREGLKKYIEGGGGFVGIHNAFGTEYGWAWYEGLLGNANYYNHGRDQDGDVVIVNNRDASTRNLPERWGFRDEWYNLVPFPTNVNFLAVVDESTMPSGPGAANSHPGHGDFHPVTWCQYYDGGRSWVTTLGHAADAFRAGSSFRGAAEFQEHLVSGIKSAMGLEPFCTPANGSAPVAPVNTAAPSISGTAEVTGLLVADPGQWDVDGLTYGYQWHANGQPIAGAANLSVTAGLAGKEITVTVTASKDGLPDGSATSGPVTVPGVPAWAATVAYDIGDRVLYQGRLFEAQWWTQNQKPGSSPTSAWAEIGATVSCPALVREWTNSGVYTEGASVVAAGRIWQAKWWTRNQAPGDPNGPWQETGACTTG